MHKVVITRNDLPKSIRSQISELYYNAYGQDVDIETLAITIEVVPNPACLHCVNYDGDEGDFDGYGDDEIPNSCLADNSIKNRPEYICDEFDPAYPLTITSRIEI